MTLDSLLSQLATGPDPRELLRGFVPPTRFAPKRFETYHPRNRSQLSAAERLQEIASGLHRRRRRSRLLDLIPARRNANGGVYLDGGFGVGKTHLLAALWSAAPAPKSYLAFDELMYFIGLYGPAAAERFHGHRLVAVDEWELDDPGNLTLALAFLRPVLASGAFVAVTSNTLPIELGAGRFSQKDFRAEIDALAAAFEVVRIEGDDYRHRHYVAQPGSELYWSGEQLSAAAAQGDERVLVSGFDPLMRALTELHPIRYRELARRVTGVYVREIFRISSLSDALRWVHFVDSIYNAGVPFGATGQARLGDLFPVEDLEGPFGKKLARCLSRMEELLSENVGRDEQGASGGG